MATESDPRDVKAKEAYALNYQQESWRRRQVEFSRHNEWDIVQYLQKTKQEPSIIGPDCTWEKLTEEVFFICVRRQTLVLQGLRKYYGDRDDLQASLATASACLALATEIYKNGVDCVTLPDLDSL